MELREREREVISTNGEETRGRARKKHAKTNRSELRRPEWHSDDSPSTRLASTPGRRANARLSVVNCEKPQSSLILEKRRAHRTLWDHTSGDAVVGGELNAHVIRFCVECRLGCQEEMQRKKRQRDGIKREYRKLIFISGSDEWNESET